MVGRLAGFMWAVAEWLRRLPVKQSTRVRFPSVQPKIGVAQSGQSGTFLKSGSGSTPAPICFEPV